MTTCEQKKVDTATNALRELIGCAAALPFHQQPHDAMVRARGALAALTAEPERSKGDKVWPSAAFWHAAYTVLAFASDQWGTYPRTRPESWAPARLTIKAGGHTQCQTF